MLTLTATPRTLTGKSAAKALLQEGLIPAVVYGPKQEAISISLSLADFKRILRTGGESSVLELSGIGEGKMQVLIQEVDVDPVTSIPRHADLLALVKGAKVEVSVPLMFIGESEAVKAGARLVKVLHELPIEAASADLPHEIEVDISVLAQDGDQIHVRDLKLPKGVTAMIDAEEVVVLTQIAEEEPEEAPALDMANIEVEQKGKTEEEPEA